MHEWHTRISTNIQELINEFTGYQFRTDHSGMQEITRVKIISNVYSSEDSARDYITRMSYGGNSAYLAAYTTKALSKAYRSAFDNFLVRNNEYQSFKDNLTIAYGRKASKVTCPVCGSSINLAYGKRYKTCPVCGSRKIISDSNWKMLDTKKKLVEKAAEKLSVEAAKNGVTFMCGIEWHC